MKLNMSGSDLIQAIMAVITAAGIFIAISANQNQLETFNEQLKLSFFADYTQRYQDLILNFPEDINAPGFDLQELDKDARDQVMKYMRAYFNLCSEEFHLNKESHIDPAVWKVWAGGMRFTFTKRAFRDAWKVIRKDTMYDEMFKRWVDEHTAGSGA